MTRRAVGVLRGDLAAATRWRQWSTGTEWWLPGAAAAGGYVGLLAAGGLP